MSARLQFTIPHAIQSTNAQKIQKGFLFFNKQNGISYFGCDSIRLVQAAAEHNLFSCVRSIFECSLLAHGMRLFKYPQPWNRICAIRFKGKTVPEIIRIWFIWMARFMLWYFSHSPLRALAHFVNAYTDRERIRFCCFFLFVSAWKTSLKFGAQFASAKHSLFSLTSVERDVMRTSCNDKDRQVIVIASKAALWRNTMIVCRSLNWPIWLDKIWWDPIGIY